MNEGLQFAGGGGAPLGAVGEAGKALAADAAALLALINTPEAQYKFHGSDATVARGTAKHVVWIGTVKPEKIQNEDLYFQYA